jgi:hypothetical protein
LFSACPDTSDAPFDAIYSGFDEGIENWTVFGDGTNPPNWESSGGIDNSGYIHATDLAMGDFWYFSAPEKFQNNISNFQDGFMHFWIFQNSTIPAEDKAPNVIIKGGTATMYHNFEVEPGSEWKEYSIPLADLFWTDGNGRFLDDDEVHSILYDVQAIYIRGEYGADLDSGGLDEFWIEKP